MIEIKLYPEIRVYHKRDESGAWLVMMQKQAEKLAAELMQKTQQLTDDGGKKDA